MNSALALKTIEVLQGVIPVSVDKIHEGIARTRWPGKNGNSTSWRDRGRCA